MIDGQNLAVVARRKEPADSLDFFPTPPWATRALMAKLYRHVSDDLNAWRVWDPCCGEGHMSAVLTETFGRVLATDIHDYGLGGVRDFLVDEVGPGPHVDWIIMNPPFVRLEAFVAKALRRARRGVAVLCRLQALEGVGRYEGLWSRYRPFMILPFAARVAMRRGVWVVNGSTATGYMWVVWLTGNMRAPVYEWIAPGARDRFSQPDDPARFNGLYRLRHLEWSPEKRETVWVETLHTPAEWAAMGRAA